MNLNMSAGGGSAFGGKPKYWAIIILGAIALSVVVLYYAKQPAPDLGPIVVHHRTATTTSQTDLKDWMTYSNSQYGFELKYPRNLYVKDPKNLKFFKLGPNGIVDFESTSKEFFFSSGMLANGAEPGVNIQTDGYRITVSSYPNPKNFTAAQWLKENSEGVDLVSMEVPDVGGEPALRFDLLEAGGYAGTLFSHDGVMFEVDNFSGCENDCTDSNPQYVEDIYEQILSTFKFTSLQTDTTAWKTYTNSEYGFELTFPDEWKGYKTDGFKFEVPTADKNPVWGSEPGYYMAFQIMVYSEQEWQEMLDEEGPKPEYIDSKGENVFVWQGSQDIPDDLKGKIKPGDIIKTFKFISPYEGR